MRRDLFRRADAIWNVKQGRSVVTTTIMVRNGAGRHLAIWAGEDEATFEASDSGTAWAAGDPLPLPSSTSPRGGYRRKAHCVDS